MRYFSQFKGLPKQIYILAFLRIFIGIGSMVFSLVSLIMTDVLGHSAFFASIVAMCLAFIKAGGAFLGGRIADVRGRRFACLFCGSITLVFYILGGVFCRSWLVIPCIFLGSIGSNGIAPAVSAIVADYAPPLRGVECFSLLYLGSNLGFALGPSIGGMLYYRHLPMTFYIQGTVYFLCALLVCLFVDENYDPAEYRRRRQEAQLQKIETKDEGLFSLLWQRKALLIFIVCMVLLYICYGMLSFMLPLHLKELFGAEAGARYIGNIWSVNGGVIVLSTSMLLIYLKKHHQFSNSMLGCIMYGIGFGMYALVDKPWLFFVSAIFWTIGEIMVSTGAGTFIASQSPESHRGRFQSLFDISGFIGKGISPPLCAFIISKAGFTGTWTMSACVCFAVSLIFGLSYKYVIKKESSI